MKKILLIIALILCIFQMVVLATAIDIGSEATDRATGLGADQTIITAVNPANASGKITLIEVYADGDMNSAKFGIFEQVSANRFTTRDWVVADNGQGAGVIKGGHQDFVVDLDVEAGDFIGIYYLGNSLSCTVAAGNWWRTYQVDSIPCVDTLFSAMTSRVLSLYGTGETVAVGIKWNGVTITKWNGITITIPLNTQ